MDINYQIPRAALLWVLASVVLVIIPQSIRMPAWLSVVALACVGWRMLIFSGRLDYPGKPMRIAVVIFTLMISISQMRNLGVGLESASSLLTLGFVFKLIEMRYKRDIYVVICLSFLMCMVAFLYSQSVIVTVYIALCVLVIIGAMVALNRSTLQSDHRTTWRMALRMGVQAIPLTIILFLVFPRIAPLWAVPVQTSAGQTGVSDEMSPGDLSALGRSNALAFRVQFENGPPPLHEQLYWRGLVLENFDGESWTRRRGRSAYSGAAEYANFQFTWRDRVRLGGEPLTYNVIQEPTQQPWIYGLHLAEPLSRNIYQSRNFEAFNNGLIAKRISYDMQSYMNSQTDILLLDSARRRNVDIPAQGNERSREFAQQLRNSVNSDRDYVYAVLRHFQENPFYYTLNPELLGENRIDDFLFNTRQGFCEHYASTFAFLMRAAGVPTRVVVGYQGAEYNRFEDYMMVYQYNAHAWNEVWLEGEGWVRFDPTGAVSPARINLGFEAALQDDPGFLDESLLAAVGRFNWVNTLRLRLDAIEYEWNRRVVNYDEEVQFELFERLFGEVTQQKAVILLIVLASIVIVGVGFTIIRIEPRRQQDPVVRLYNRLSDELAKHDLARRKGEGPLSYRDRVIASKPELAEAMTELTELYVQISYRQQADERGLERHQYAALQASFRQLRSLLSPLRQRLG